MYTVALMGAVCVIGVIWHVVNKRLYGDMLSPLNLLLYFWVIPFILCFARLSALQSGLETNAVAILFVCTCLLAATCLIPALLVRPGSGSSFAEQSGRRVAIRPAGILLFFLVTAVALYFAEFSDRDLPLLVYLLGGATDANLNTVGKDSKLQILAFGIYAAATFIFYLWLHERRRLRRHFYLLLSLAVIGVGLVKTSKSDIYIPILTYGSLIYYHYRQQNKALPIAYKISALLLGLGVTFVTVIRLQGVGVAGGYADAIDFKYSQELGPIASEVAAIIYGYLALGFQNFSNYVNSHSVEFRIGSSFFRPFLSLIMRGDIADSMTVPVAQWNVVSDAANTGTFLTPLFVEGGPLFCFLGSLIYGFIVNVTYAIFRSTRRTSWMFVYTALLFPWTWLFFTNAFSVLSIYSNIIYIFLLSWLFVRISPSRRTASIGPLIVSQSPTPGIGPSLPLT